MHRVCKKKNRGRLPAAAEYAVHGKTAEGSSQETTEKVELKCSKCMQLGWRPDKPPSDIE
eukprot:4600872-Amphidinium_carterae.1